MRWSAVDSSRGLWSHKTSRFLFRFSSQETLPSKLEGLRRDDAIRWSDVCAQINHLSNVKQWHTRSSSFASHRDDRSILNRIHRRRKMQSLSLCLDSTVVPIAMSIGEGEAWRWLPHQAEAVSRLHQGNFFSDKILSFFIFSDEGEQLEEKRKSKTASRRLT